MNMQYGYFIVGSGGSTGAYSGGATDSSGEDYFAAGAFDGTLNLPPNGTALNNVPDFQGYVRGLEAKTTEISADPFDLGVKDVTTQYVVLGGTAGDRIEADRSTLGDGLMMGRAGDDTLAGGLGHNTLLGGGGADTLISLGTGDRLLGGPGDDHIEINDLNARFAAHVGALTGGDLLDLTGSANAFGHAAWSKVPIFDGLAGEVMTYYHPHHNQTSLLFDFNEDRVVDYKITIRGGDYTDFSHIAGYEIPAAVTPDPNAVHNAGALVV